MTLSMLMGLSHTPTIIRIQEWVKKHKVSILFDSGATHSFVDPKIVKQFGLTIKRLHKVMKVKVANGQLMPCIYICPEFSWTMGDKFFTFNMVLLKAGGSDIILGMDWVDSVTPIMLHTRPRSI